jgi:CheY-like chemotaxis protein
MALLLYAQQGLTQLSESILGSLIWRTLHNQASDEGFLLQELLLRLANILITRSWEVGLRHGSLLTPYPQNGIDGSRFRKPDDGSGCSGLKRRRDGATCRTFARIALYMCRGWRLRGHRLGSFDLSGRAILVVEDEPLIALDLQTALEGAGATVVTTTARDAAQVVAQQNFSVGILDFRPGSSDHRPIVRRLKERGIPFLFYSTHPPEDVTTVRGAPVVLKPERPKEIVRAIALLLGGPSRVRQRKVRCTHQGGQSIDGWIEG